jgi:outer membrane protein assembly factor BamB
MKIALIIAIIASTFAKLPLSSECANYTWKTYANSACTSEIKDGLNIIPAEIILTRKKEDKIEYTVTDKNNLIVVKVTGKTSSIVCFNIIDMNKKWTYETQTAIYNPPICYNGNIYYYANKLITSISLENGKKRASVPADKNMNRYCLNAFDGKIYYSSINHLTCYNSMTLNKIWESKVDDINDAFCISDNKIIVPTLKHLFAINALSGTVEWKIETPYNLGTKTLVYKKVVYKVFDGDVRSYSLNDGSLIRIRREESPYTIAICNDNLILTNFDLDMKSLSLDLKKQNWCNKEITFKYLCTLPLVIDDKILFVFFFKNLRSYRLAMINGKDGIFFG